MAKKIKSSIYLPEEVDKVTRRQFLETGVSFTAYASLANLFPHLAQAQSFTVQKNLIWINMRGGWDILEVTDPKASSTSGIDMSYSWDQARTLAGSSSSIKIGRWLPNIAQRGSDVVVVRGLAMGTTSHDAGSVYMDTGVLSNAGNVNAASIPSIVASESDATIPIIQLNGGADPELDRGLLNPVSVVRAQNLELYKSLYPTTDKEKTLQLRMLEYLRDSVSDKQTKTGSNDRLTSISTAEEKIRAQINANVGNNLSVSAEEIAAYTSGAPENFNSSMAESMALTAKLIKNDVVNCVNLGFGGFDTHANQSASLEPTLRSFDFLIGKIMDDLSAAGKLDSTLIVCYSDFGRTPKVNGRNGRDHWPVGGALMIGGGIDGGRAVGGTNNNLLAQNTNITTGAVSNSGSQLSPINLGGSVLELTLGSSYMTYRTYLESIAALTALK